MYKLLAAFALLFLSLNALAGYKGQDPDEMAFTFIGEDEYVFYEPKPTDVQAITAPICADRQIAERRLPNGKAELGCWWMIGELYYVYTVLTGVKGANPDLVSRNDNFIPNRKPGIRY